MIDPIIVPIDERLATTGSYVPVAGHVDLAGYSLGDHEFELPHGIDYDVVLTNTGDGILATGLVKADVVGVCDRCLDPAHFAIASELNEYFLHELPDEDELADDEDDVDFSLVGEDDTIDLAEPVMAAVIMETPFVVLCKEDCKGLCPHCGANLNEGDCGCADSRPDAVDPMNPFAALADLQLDDAGKDEDPKA